MVTRFLSRLRTNREFQETAARWRAFEKTKTYDFLAALPVIVWYAITIASEFNGLAGDVARARIVPPDLHSVISMLARAAGILFIGLALILLGARRTPKAKAKGLVPRIMAAAGAYFMIAVIWLPRHDFGVALSLLSLAMILAGMSFSVFSLAHLGRSFSLMPEARQLVRSGPYAFVRHPLYLGEAISTLGLLLQYLSPAGVAIVALQLAFQVQRMKNEEQVLGSLFPEYSEYRSRTARLVPGIY